MKTTNDVILPADSWKALPVGNKGIKLLSAGNLNIFLNDVDVAPTTQVGDNINMGDSILWDVGTFAWVKTLNRVVSVVIYS